MVAHDTLKKPDTLSTCRSAIVSCFFFAQENYVMLQLAMREQYRKNQERLDTIGWDVIKQLLDEVEHDIMNYQNRGLQIT